MDILDVIASRPRWRMSRLAHALYLDPSTVTRSVDRLAEYGLVTRVPAADDGRGVQVRATAAGRALAKTVGQRRRVVMGKILHDLSIEESQDLAQALERLVSAVSAYAENLEVGPNDAPVLLKAMPASERPTWPRPLARAPNGPSRRPASMPPSPGCCWPCVNRTSAGLTTTASWSTV
jgi:DNA-binding MarR family transcriptional regulator